MIDAIFISLASIFFQEIPTFCPPLNHIKTAMMMKDVKFKPTQHHHKMN